MDRQNKQYNCQNLIRKEIFMDFIFTPNKKIETFRLEISKRFVRKPGQKSQRSSSKKSFDTSVKEMYIKTPSSIQKEKGREADFFAALAQQIIAKEASSSTSKQEKKGKSSQRNSQKFDQGLKNINTNQQKRTEKKEVKRNDVKISTLQAEIQLKNHEISILSGEIQRFRSQIDEQRQKKKKAQSEKKDMSREIKQLTKLNDNLKMEAKKHEREKQHLLKQIQFLQRINFDEKTRNLQSYRQKYLQSQVQKLKKQLIRSKGDRQQELDRQIHTLKQEKFTIQSHYKAMKVANQCLVKQLNNNQDSIHEMILNSYEYKTLRDKYIRFLQQYKKLRNEYWSLKVETNNKNLGYDSSSFFSITNSEVEEDLSILKNESSILKKGGNSQTKPKGSKSIFSKENIEDYEPTYGLL